MGFRPCKLAIAVVALLATLTVASLAASPEHTHLQATCSICVAGNLPAENPPAAIITVAAPGPVELLTSAEVTLRIMETRYRLPDGRAPPA